jgi:apolipoprotein N-acyltransferase
MPRPARVRTPPLPPAPWWAFVVAGLAYGVCTALSLPPGNVWPLALIAITPLVWAACRANGRVKRAALLVALGTLPFWAFEHLWLWDVAAPGYPILCVYLSMYAAFFVWIIAHARRSDWPIPMAILVPILWTASEVLRGEYVIGGYCWFLVGHPLIDAPFFAAPGATIGAYGVSFLCAALAGAVADAAGWSGVPRSWGGIGASTLAIAWFLLGLPAQFASGPDASAKSLRVAVVQTNLPQDNKMGWSVESRRKDLNHFFDLTRQAAAARPTPDVICWPETMFPGMALNPDAIQKLREGGVHYKSGLAATQFGDDLSALQTELGIPMLVGCTAVEGDILADLGVPGHPQHSRIFNSVVLVDKGRPTGTRYDKVELTPFGEVIPFLWRWPDAQNWVVNLGAAGMQFELSPGARAAGLDVPVSRPELGARSVRVAAPICFEGTRSALCRRLIRGDGSPQDRSSALINFSNDGWFGWWDSGRRQHLLAARWRCVELGVPMIRCVNTGVSCVIDGRGRVVSEQLQDKTGPNDRTDGVLLASIPIEPGRSPTIFERTGLFPAYVVMAAGLAGTLVLWRRSRRVASGAI